MTDQREPLESEPPVGVEDLIHHTELPNTRISEFWDASIGWAGYTALISTENVRELPE